MGYKFKLTKTQLEKEYLIDHQDAKKIAKKYGVSPACVRYWLKKYNIPTKDYRHLKFEDLSGRRFGLLIVLKRMPNQKRRCTRWLCKCQCGNQLIIPRCSLVHALTTSCGCKRKKMMFRGIGDLSGCYWTRVVRGAKKRKLTISISIKDAWEKYLRQGKKCALSGAPIYIFRDYTRKRKLHTASLDRKDPNVGYTKSNVQWVHRDINMAKRKMSNEDFIIMCKRIANHARKTKRRTIN